MTFWCTIHQCPWKACPCPGTITARGIVTAELIDATRPRANAFAAAVSLLVADSLAHAKDDFNRPFPP